MTEQNAAGAPTLREEDRLLLDGTLVRASEHRHIHADSSPTAPRGDEQPSLTIIRHGAHLHHARGEAVVADAGSAILYRGDEPFRLSHPFLQAEADVSLYLGFDRALLDELFGADSGARELGHPLVPAVQLAATMFAARAGEGDALADEERALMLLGDVSHGLARDRDDPSIAAVARQRVAIVREALAAAPHAHLDLAALAALADCSPFHLTRLFRRVTGLTIGGLRLRLRLARVLQGLADGADDLTALALDTGFADHAHMTNSMRRMFGTTPSALREMIGAQALAAKSKAIQAGVDPID